MSENQLTPLRRFFNLLRVNKQDIVSIYVFALFNGLISLSLPLGIQAIINLLGSNEVSSSWVILVVIVIVGVAATGVLQVMQLTITENIQKRIFTHSAFEFAYRIPRIKLESINKLYFPEMVNRFFDTLSVQKGLSKILMDFSSASLQILFGLLLLSLYHPFFIIFSVFLLLYLGILFYFTSAKGVRTSLRESTVKYQVAHWLEDLARNMETFRLAGKSDFPLQKTDDLVNNYLEARKIHFKTLLLQFFNLVTFKVIVAAGLLVIGGLLVLNQQMNIGQFVASEIIIITVLASVEKLILSMETIYDVLTAIEKLGSVMDLPLERKGGTVSTAMENSGMSVRMEKLTFGYTADSNNILHNINLKVESGQKLCLSGSNGSGKTTLLQTLAALYHGYSGSLVYDDLPLGNWNLNELRKYIGDNLAREEFFTGTFYENISLGKPGIDLNHVKEISKVLNLHSYIESMPKGYDCEIMAEGQNLPKHIRTKVMLARCLTGNPRLVLLEDNFNALPPSERNSILNYLLEQPFTLILVSNSVEICQRLDRVIVMNEGTIEFDGECKELKAQPWFKTIFE